MIGDVHSILAGEDGGQKVSLTTVGGASSKKSSVRVRDTFKRPEGMHRELYNLLNSADGKDMTSIMPTDIKKGYKNPKVQMGLRAVRKFKWVAFNNEARTDNLQLHHWQRVDRLENPEPYVFARFNKVINVPDFTDEVYEKHLKSVKWSREETRYLFEMCRRFDLRWPIVIDRYEKTKFGNNRSMEDMKERFYSIVHELAVLKDPTAEPICYDAEHERRRKEQLCKQWDRTTEELEEEEMLMNELKRIELRKKEREKKAQDLQKLINMAEAPASPSLNGPGISPALGKKKTLFRPKAGSSINTSTINFNFNPMDISASAIRFTEFKSAGAHFRSQEMKLPTNVGQKKLKNIEVVLEKCKMEMNPMGSEQIVSIYNDFRSQVMLLQELKSTLQTAEFELESVRNRLQEQGKTLEIEPRMRISNLPEGGLDESVVGINEQAPTTTRRITSYIDVTTAVNPLIARKRKSTFPTTPSSPSQMDLKRSRKN